MWGGPLAVPGPAPLPHSGRTQRHLDTTQWPQRVCPLPQLLLAPRPFERISGFGGEHQGTGRSGALLFLTRGPAQQEGRKEPVRR